MKNLSILTLLAILLASCAPTSAPASVTTGTPLPTATLTTEPTATFTPEPIATILPSTQESALSVTLTLDPEYVAFESIKTALRTDNPHAPRVVVISSDYHEKGDILVSWIIVGTLTDPNLNANIRDDATRIIKALAQNPFNYTSAVLEAYWPSQDVYGALSEKLVVNLIYKKSSIDKINWDTFVPDNIYLIADSSFVDSAFQGK